MVATAPEQWTGPNKQEQWPKQPLWAGNLHTACKHALSAIDARWGKESKFASIFLLQQYDPSYRIMKFSPRLDFAFFYGSR